MKLLSYGLDQRMEPRLAFSLNGYAVDVMRASLWMKENHQAQDYLSLASSMLLTLQHWNRSLSLLKNLEHAFKGLDLATLSIYGRPLAILETEIVFFAPIPDPPSMRYFSAFDSDLDFSFGNTQTLLGHDQPLKYAGLAARGEIAIIVAGMDMDLKIAGYCIVNNWIDPQLDPQTGLAHGLATSIGPYLVTSDELEPHQLGKGLSLDMQIRLNGKPCIENRFNNLIHGFPEMIQQAKPTNIQAGDILCSGSPVNSSKMNVLKSGDRVDVEIQMLGTLSNSVGILSEDQIR